MMANAIGQSLPASDVEGRREGRTAEVRAFYDQRGWTRGMRAPTMDKELFGARHVGPIQLEGYALRRERILSWFRHNGAAGALLECGCGGNPGIYLKPVCRSYVGVDVSVRGLGVARDALSKAAHPRFGLVAGDGQRLPFPDGVFDGVYSAHTLYHVADKRAQLAVFDELVRVLRPGGVAAFILANPRPLAFPMTIVKRLLAESPLGPVLDRLRPPAPLPYRPLRLGLVRNHLAQYGSVSFEVHEIASMWFRRHVREKGAGRLAWRVVCGMERRWPRASTIFASYVTVVLHKSTHRGESRGRRSE